MGRRAKKDTLKGGHETAAAASRGRRAVREPIDLGTVHSCCETGDACGLSAGASPAVAGVGGSKAKVRRFSSPETLREAVLRDAENLLHVNQVLRLVSSGLSLTQSAQWIGASVTRMCVLRQRFYSYGNAGVAPVLTELLTKSVQAGVLDLGRGKKK